MTETKEEEEDWVKLAMGDACLVANLLLRLLGDPPPAPPPPPSSRTRLDWTIRGRRSRGPSSRESPSTPLSWTTEEEEEESHPLTLDGCNAVRSKATSASGAPNTSAGKRPRQKKKSLFELKEEETLLLKERHSLKQELARLKLHVEEERAANENLKRLRVNSVSVDDKERLVSQSHCHRRDAVKRPCSPMVRTFEKAARLPDLNIPLEE